MTQHRSYLWYVEKESAEGKEPLRWPWSGFQLRAQDLQALSCSYASLDTSEATLRLRSPVKPALIAEHAQMAQFAATEADLAWQSDAHYACSVNDSEGWLFVCLPFHDTSQSNSLISHCACPNKEDYTSASANNRAYIISCHGNNVLSAANWNCFFCSLKKKKLDSPTIYHFWYIGELQMCAFCVVAFMFPSNEKKNIFWCLLLRSVLCYRSKKLRTWFNPSWNCKVYSL